jgi:Zn-dependent protease
MMQTLMHHAIHEDMIMGNIEQDLLHQMKENYAAKEHQKAENEYKKAKSSKGKFGILGVLVLLAWQFKALLFLFLAKFKFLLIGFKFLGISKVLLTGGTMLLSVFSYAILFGFPFGLGFAILILIHEMGHVLALKFYKIKSSMPVFVPFFGAFVALKEMPKNVRIEAIVAIAGPVLGTLGSLACHGIYMLTGQSLYLSLAYSSYLVNLGNLIPVLPFDGGRVAGALSPKLWIFGLVIGIGMFISYHNPIPLLLMLLFLPRLFRVFRLNPEEADYYRVTPSFRFIMALAYFGLAAMLGMLMLQSHNALQVLLGR